MEQAAATDAAPGKTPIWLYGLRAMAWIALAYVVVTYAFDQLLWPDDEPRSLLTAALKGVGIGLVITLWEWAARRRAARA